MPDPGEIVRKACGFLEEAPGVKSSTRLYAAILLALAGLVVLAELAYIFVMVERDKTVDGTVLLGLNGTITALVAQGVVAIIRRSGGD